MSHTQPSFENEKMFNRSVGLVSYLHTFFLLFLIPPGRLGRSYLPSKIPLVIPIIRSGSMNPQS